MSSVAPQRTTFFKFFQSLCRFITTVMFDLKVYGRHNMPKQGGALLLANHQSYLDPIIIGVQMTRPISYMAKIELFESNRLFGWLLRGLQTFPVRRGEGDVGAVKQAIARLQEGYILNMFPEGTRSRTGELGTIQRGVALLVRRASVPVIPVAIDGSFKAWPKGGKAIRSHPVRILIGPALKIEGLKPDQIVVLLEQTLRQMIGQLRSGKIEEFREELVIS